MNLVREICFQIMVQRKEESFLQSLLEGYDGMVTILNTKPGNGEIEMIISSSEGFRETLRLILDDLRKTVGISFKEEGCP